MCAAAGVILLLYPGIGIVAAGVLPLEKVAGQPLTLVASEIFPQALFVLFMICGPLMALMANINSLFLAYTEPVQQAAEDGWFGKNFEKRNKQGTPVTVSTILWLVGSFPIILGAGHSNHHKQLYAAGLYFDLLYDVFSFAGSQAHA